MADRRRFEFSAKEKAFNEWHRQDSISRYISTADARALAALDLDLCEYSRPGGPVVLLHEVAEDRGQSGKQTKVISSLAEQAGIFALCTLYKLSDEMNPHSPGVPDISGFRVRRIWPDPQQGWKSLTPREYATYLNIKVKKLKESARI